MHVFTVEGSTRFRTGMEEIVASGAAPGVVALLGDGSRAQTVTFGVADIATGEPMREDAIFRIQSMTKPVLAVATMQLVEQGVLSLHDPVERWLPELANRMVLRAPGGELDDVVPAKRSITVDDLLTCRSGYGAVFSDPGSPIARAMEERGVDPGPVPQLISSDEWLARLAELPLIHHPGEGWRYHTSFDILGILVSRVTGASLDDHLRSAIFEPLGMPDTSMFVPAGKRHRLPAVYRRDEASGELIELEPAGGGYHVAEPPFDVSHGELVSTARDFYRFASMLMRGGELDGIRLLSDHSVAIMTRDHIDPPQKDPNAFFPGFWDEDSWGYGMGMTTAPDVFGEPGRYHWMGGYGTAWFNDPGIGLVGIFLAQVLIDERVLEAIQRFYQAAYDASM